MLFALHGWSNKKYEITEYYLKYIFFFVCFEKLATPLIGNLIYTLNAGTWCFLHLTLYIILLTPRTNYLNLIFDTLGVLTNTHSFTAVLNTHVVNPLNDQIGRVWKKLKTS